MVSNKGIINPPAQTDQPQGIYLLDKSDGRNVHTLRFFEQVLQEEFLDIQFGTYVQWIDRECVHFPVIYSSTNEFLLTKVAAKMIVLPYYYINPDTEEWEEMWENK